MVEEQLSQHRPHPALAMHITPTFIALAAATSAYASCSSFGSGATDTVSSPFTLSADDATAGTTSPLNLLTAQVVPMAAWYALSVRYSDPLSSTCESAYDYFLTFVR